MFTKSNTIYADAGKYLSYKNMKVYQLKDIYDCEEKSINIDNIFIDGIFLILSDDLRIINHKEWSYAQWKTYFIKLRYSNDDQIAILLNKDNSEEDSKYYSKMQEWREWSAQISKRLVELNA